LIYLSIELTSLASYALTGLSLNHKSSEGAFKYVLFGGVSSAIMLYGVSLMYGEGGTLFIHEMAGSGLLMKVGVFLFLAGLLFKTSIVPFHVWVPGTYQVAPSDAVALFSIVPKLAGFGLLYHVYSGLSADLREPVAALLILLSVITILWATFSAILQKNIKRLIAYGAIAHSGFLLPLLLIDGGRGIKGFVFYAVVYVVMNLGVFHFIQSFEKSLGDNMKIKDFRGLGQKQGWLGAMAVIILIGLIGLPPTGGFTAKLVLFSNVWFQYQSFNEPIWLTLFIAGIMSTAISLYYYLKIPYAMFLESGSKNSVVTTKFNRIASTFFALALLYIFLHGDILDIFVNMTPLPDLTSHE
jgi:NADH-quinone oxidoreductase subunit N